MEVIKKNTIRQHARVVRGVDSIYIYIDRVPFVVLKNELLAAQVQILLLSTGSIAQMVERSFCIREVARSMLAGSN